MPYPGWFVHRDTALVRTRCADRVPRYFVFCQTPSVLRKLTSGRMRAIAWNSGSMVWEGGSRKGSPYADLVPAVATAEAE